MPKWFWLSVLAAVLFGCYAVPLKKASMLCRSTGDFMGMLFWTGIAIACSGLIGILWFQGSPLNRALMLNSVVGGIIWFLGMVAVMLALREPNASVGLIACVYDSNALIALVLGFVFFQEYKTTNMTYSIIGALAIVTGAGFIGFAGNQKK